MIGTSIEEIKNLYGTIDSVRKIEHTVTNYWYGLRTSKHSYIETFFEDDDATKKPKIGFGGIKT